MEFILQKTAGAVSSAPATHNVDPFTGGGAYVPGAAATFPQPGAQRSNYQDPFTGAGGYVPGTPMDIETSMCFWLSVSWQNCQWLFTGMPCQSQMNTKCDDALQWRLDLHLLFIAWSCAQLILTQITPA